MTSPLDAAAAPGDPARMRPLRRTGALRTAPDPDLQGVASLAALICAAPVAAVVVHTAQRQLARATVGVGVEALCVDLADSVCSITVASDDVVVVTDLATDPRTSHMRAVQAAGLHSYAGTPIRVDGVAVGTVHVLDPRVRTFTDEQVDALWTLSGLAALVLSQRTGRDGLGTRLARAVV